jgi:hypothetical protein
MRRPAKKLSFRLENHVNSYALAASAAGVGIMALTRPAEAKIVYTPAHVVIRANQNYGLDLAHNRQIELVLKNSVRRRVFPQGSFFRFVGFFWS